ncbi:NADP-dependent oxidoreductase domain-containing protein, partial [Mycena floridula]
MSDISATYTQLGNSGLKISVPVIGAMSLGSSKWGSKGWPLDEEESIKLLKAAWDRGLNTIDTANMYSNGESERVIGKFIKKYEIPRSQIIIASKCFCLVSDKIEEHIFFMPHLKETRRYVNQGGLSRAAIFNSVEETLQRLDTPYLDILLIHRYDPEVPAEETMKALHDLIQMGKVRYIGASSMRAWQFAHLNEVAEKHNWTKFVCMQSEYSLLYREDEREMIPYCKSAGIGLIPWSPLHQGDLARPISNVDSVRHQMRQAMGGINYSDADKLIIARVEEIAKKRDQPMTRVALTWLGSKVTSPIIGISSVERLEEAIKPVSFTLTEDEINYLEEPYEPKPIRGHA